MEIIKICNIIITILDSGRDLIVKLAPSFIFAMYMIITNTTELGLFKFLLSLSVIMGIAHWLNNFRYSCVLTIGSRCRRK